MTEQTRIVHRTPTLRARVRQTLGGAICRQLGHSPQMVEKTYRVTTGPPRQIGEVRMFLTGKRVGLYGFPTEPRTSRAVICRRCRVTCGDSIVEGGR
jgi:hypothetical protein